MNARKRRREIASRRCYCDRAAGRQTTRFSKRRDVEPQIIRAELRVCIAPTTLRDHAADHILNRKDATAESERASNDPAPPIHHFDAQLLTAQRCVKRAGRCEQRRSRRAQLRNLNGPLAQGSIERTVQMTTNQNVNGHTDEDEREEDRDRARDDRPYT